MSEEQKRLGKTICSIINEARLASLGVMVEEGFRPSVPFVATASAESNHQLIGEMVELAKFFRRTPASPDQAAEILGLRRKVTTSTH
jgi:hypothetical protein